MRITRILIRVSLLGMLVSLTNCKTQINDDPNPNVEIKFEPGFGDSEERPVGTPYEWPKGITLVGKVEDDYDCYIEAEEKKRHFGNGELVSLCLNFVNSTSQPINVTLPPGLMWISKSRKVQNGIIVKKVVIKVPANQRYFAVLHAYCVNTNRDPSAGYEYEEQPIVTNHPDMQELYRLVANKKVNLEEYGNVRDSVGVWAGASLGVAVGNIAHGEPIDDLVLSWIKAIPDAK